jgi:hypothetical protein
MAVCGVCGHVQKRTSERLLSDMAEIYRQYEMYPLSDGCVQVIFTVFSPSPRTARLLEKLDQTVKIGNTESCWISVAGRVFFEDLRPSLS